MKLINRILADIFVLRFKPILKTRRFKCDQDARTEVHSLICHSHLSMYIMSLKSLLRFYDDLAIVAHDDGSLSDADIQLLETHIKGVKVISRKDADAVAAGRLKEHPHCSKFRDSALSSLQLFDFIFYSGTGKIIALDSDTLFFQKPERLIEWIRAGNKEIIHLYEKAPWRQKEFLSKFNHREPCNFCLGFACFYSDIVDLKAVEAVLAKAGTGDWWLAQNIFAVLMKDRSGEYRAHCFEMNQYQDFNTIEDGAVFRHYWFSAAFTNPYKGLKSIYSKDANKVIGEIGTQ